jgi:hypothetical protein
VTELATVGSLPLLLSMLLEEEASTIRRCIANRRGGA